MNSFLAACLGLSLVGVTDPNAIDRKKKDPVDPAVQKKAPAAPAKNPGGRPGGFPVPGVQFPPNMQIPPGMKLPPNVAFPKMPMPGPGMRPPAMPVGGNFAPPQGFPFAQAKKAELPKELIPALIESLKDKEKDVRQYAAGSLARLGKDAVGPLIDLLKGKDRAQKANAAYVLGQIGEGAREEALPLLIKALKDDAKEVRIRAAFAIERMVRNTQTSPAMTMGMANPAMNMMARLGQQDNKAKVTLPTDPGTVAPSGEPAKAEKAPARKADEEKPAKEKKKSAKE